MLAEIGSQRNYNTGSALNNQSFKSNSNAQFIKMKNGKTYKMGSFIVNGSQDNSMIS